MRPAPHEVKATSVKVYGSSCLGCKRHDASIMIAFERKTTIPARGIVDVFLDRGDAERIFRALKQELGR